MPVLEIANYSNVSSMDLISHAQSVRGVMRDKAVESRQLSGLASTTADLGKALLDEVKKVQKSGAEALVCDDPENTMLDVKKVIRMLKESSSTLQDVASKLNSHARAYESQMASHDHLMTGFLSFTPLSMRVGTCEKQANGWMSRQKDYLQANMAKIQEAEHDIVGIRSMVCSSDVQPALTPSARRLLNSL